MKTNRFWIILFGGILALSSALAFYITRLPGNAACVYQDGTLIERIDLSKINEPYEFSVVCDGGFNVIRVEQGRIRVSHSDCPDGLCVRQGFISGGLVPIACLPHRLIIQIANDYSDGIDAVSN